MCQTIIVNKTHELSTLNDLIVMIPKAAEVLGNCIEPHYLPIMEGEKMNGCLCPVNLELLLRTLNIPFAEDPCDSMGLLIELPPEVVEQANVAELWENRHG